MLYDPRIELARVSEGLAFMECDVEKPLPPASFGQSRGCALAVVEYVRHFVDHEVRHGIGITEVERRDETGRLLAQVRPAAGPRDSASRLRGWRGKDYRAST